MMGTNFPAFPQALVQEGRWDELKQFAETHQETFTLSLVGETGEGQFRSSFAVQGDTTTIFHLQ